MRGWLYRNQIASPKTQLACFYVMIICMNFLSRKTISWKGEILYLQHKQRSCSFVVISLCCKSLTMQNKTVLHIITNLAKRPHIYSAHATEPHTKVNTVLCLQNKKKLFVGHWHRETLFAIVRILCVTVRPMHVPNRRFMI